jgi:hypothetical protein
MQEFILNRAFALASVEDIDQIMKVDAPFVASDVETFVDANRGQYFIAINSWLLFVKKFSPYSWPFLLQRMKAQGLLRVIKDLDAVGDCVVHGETYLDTLGLRIARDVARNVSDDLVPFGEKRVGADPLATVLFLFRYLKRFSPIGADLLEKDSIRSFREGERRLRRLMRRYIKEHKWYVPGQHVPYGRDNLVYSGPDATVYLPEFITSRVKDKIASLDWDRVLRLYSQSLPQDWMFTPGVCYESGGGTLLGKLRILSKQYPEYFLQPMHIPYTGCWVQDSPVLTHQGVPKGVVRVIAVPKSYKTARIVAPEELQRQMKARLVFSFIEDILPDAINLRNQQINADASREGSLTGEISTIDMSAASDCVSTALVATVFPSKVYALFQELTASYYTLGEGFEPLQMFSTMGNSLTFVIESIVFWAITECAVEFHERMTGTKVPVFDSIKGVVQVYGDDCCVPTVCATECIEWLEACGFIVNHHKSFTSRERRYRESCGEEWYEGLECSAYYWPRKEIRAHLDKKGRVTFESTQTREWDGLGESELRDSTESIISLQHRLYGISDDADFFLCGIVSQAHPNMTYSDFGSDRGDLWGIEASPRFTWAPMDPALRKGLNLTDAPDHLRRELHYVKSNVPRVVKLSPFDQRLLNTYRYQQFLRFGPRYASKLDELLGISIPPVSDRDASGQVDSNWSFRIF